MVSEIFESKDNNADENGPILKQKFNNTKISDVTCMFHTSQSFFDHVHRLKNKAVPIQPFSSILGRFLLMKKRPKLKLMRVTLFSHNKLILGQESDWKLFPNDWT